MRYKKELEGVRSERSTRVAVHKTKISRRNWKNDEEKLERHEAVPRNFTTNTAFINYLREAWVYRGHAIFSQKGTTTS